MTNKQRNLVYWGCQIIGWGLYMAFLFIAIYLFMPENESKVLYLQPIIGISLLIVSHGMRTFYKRNRWVDKKWLWLIPRVLVACLVFSVIGQIVIHLFMIIILDWESYRPLKLNEFFGYVMNVTFVYFVWSALYFSYHFVEKNRRREIENLELQANLKDAEVTILKSQINPHFLFNALNNIRSLILIEPEKARDMITHISDLLRYFIQFNSQETVSLKEEIEVVKDYLKLESIQFDERLSYEINIDEKYSETRVPPMSLQLLVENAIKHGLAELKEGGFIKIESQPDGSNLTLKVINSGQVLQKPSSNGIGIKNLTDRIEMLFGKLADFELINSSENTVTASFKVPMK